MGVGVISKNAVVLAAEIVAGSVEESRWNWREMQVIREGREESSARAGRRVEDLLGMDVVHFSAPLWLS